MGTSRRLTDIAGARSMAFHRDPFADSAARYGAAGYRKGAVASTEELEHAAGRLTGRLLGQLLRALESASTACNRC